MKQFQGVKNNDRWIVNQVIIDTVRAIFPLAQGEGSTPVAPLNCDTSRRQSLSRRIRCRTSHASITANSRANPIQIIGKSYFSRVLPPRTKPSSTQSQTSQRWSWYGPGFYGRRTTNGELFRKGTLTAAHRTLPFGTIVRVINLENGRSVNVRINDRGPFKYHRVIDLAHGAASELNMLRAGEINVRLEVID